MNTTTTSPETSGSTTRRQLLHRLGVGALLAGFLGSIAQSLRSLVPNVLYEPSQRMKLGLPAALPDGMTFLEERRLYVFKEGRSFFAISGACTHLGCTVKHTKLNQPKRVELSTGTVTINHEFQCPCHGSKFTADGTNYAGPAPRPLRWYKLELSPDDGQLVADLDQEVDQGFRLTV